MRLNDLELIKEKTKAKKEKIYRKEITWNCIYRILKQPIKNIVRNKTINCVHKLCDQVCEIVAIY